MPKQIKKEEMKKSDRAYRKWAVAGLISSVAFMGALAGLIGLITKTNGDKAPTTVLFSLYAVYTAVSVISAVKGIMSYVREDVTVCLFQGLLNAFSAIACIMNLRMAFIILLSAYHAEDMANKLIGSQTQTEFVQTQYANWICLSVAVLISIIIGILGIVKLTKNRKN